MQNSKWQMNRVGLIDFWYYDEEEFYFLDGRMLLRGSNGSGKSVTMQSFIPLLLDGNMRPERLDPFGSRARRMENYLLEEGDGREERTGYLFMELKRSEGENYLTVGIGLRARRNKKLDSWYFYINDGRRIGRDLFLYRDVENKIAYSKLELKNRIGEGGRVFESQAEYMDYVNRLLFGFEKPEEYKELVDLLIQLRTPKLSKDFKPSVVNDILSNSLQTLSEDDLRPMSEAIENMDALRTNLGALKESVQAAGQIRRVYDTYNQMVLYEKASLAVGAEKERRRCEEAARELAVRLEGLAESLRGEEENYTALGQEAEVLKTERESLADNDAVRLKEQELELTRQIEDEAVQIDKKQQQAAEKEEKFRDVLRKTTEQEETNERSHDAMAECLAEMGEALEEIPFDEYAFLADELVKAPAEEYNFRGHSQILGSYATKVENGIEALNREVRARERLDEQISRVDELRKKQESCERETGQYRSQLEEIRGELTERLYAWSKNNRELRLPDAGLQSISRSIGSFHGDSDYGDIREVARAEKERREGTLADALLTAGRALKEHAIACDEKQAELTAWQNKQDPEPETDAAVKKNRELLTRRGIPYRQFYKCIDFDRALNPERASRLEEALLAMGLLDALVVPAEYRKQILTLDPGVCDRYVFGDIRYVNNNLMDVLDVENPDNDILYHQSIAAILQGIGCMAGDGAQSTWINEDGSFRLGVLEGTVTGEYEARYIGVRAREAYRLRMVDQLTVELDGLEQQRQQAECDVQTLTEQRAVLGTEWASFPSGDDLRTAARDYESAKLKLERTEEQLRELRERAVELEKALAELVLEVREICAATYLPACLEIFRSAREALAQYQEILTRLQIEHNRYRQGLVMRRGFKDQEAELEADLDEIRYELVRLRQRDAELKQRRQSVQEQLELTDYEEIRERLEFCVRRLDELPKLREESVQTRTNLQNQLDGGKQEQVENENRLLLAAGRLNLFLKAFEAEYRLEYVERHFVITDDMADQAKKVCQMLAGAFGNKKQSDLFGDVQTAYHQYRGYLLEYNLTMDNLFDEPQEETYGGIPSLKRLDITGKYRGISVKFRELYDKLKGDLTEQENLLSDKDRELFEDILANTISKKIRVRIQESNLWVDKMNRLMESMVTSSGLKLSLKWKNKRAEEEEQMDTRMLVALLQKDAEIMRSEEIESLSRHFRSKIEAARKLADDGGSIQSFHAVIREVLDYRRWFEFQLEFQKTGESKKELTDRAFFTFSGGEKAMAMYVPLFSAVVAKYAGARADAPRIISLDEAFAGVDEMNIKDMFRLMVQFEFNFMINSQILWGDYETVPALAIYQLIRPENARYVTVISYIWNGSVRMLADDAVAVAAAGN